MPTKKKKASQARVVVAGRNCFSGPSSAVEISGRCIYVHPEDDMEAVSFVYVMKDGQYANIATEQDVEKVTIDE